MLRQRHMEIGRPHDVEPPQDGEDNARRQRKADNPIHDIFVGRAGGHAFVVAQVDHLGRAGKKQIAPGLCEARPAALVAREVEAVEGAEDECEQHGESAPGGQEGGPATGERSAHETKRQDDGLAEDVKISPPRVHLAPKAPPSTPTMPVACRTSSTESVLAGAHRPTRGSDPDPCSQPRTMGRALT